MLPGAEPGRPSRRTGSFASRSRGSPRSRRLAFERLEPRNLLAGEISGHLWNDLDGDGVRGADEPPLAGRTVFLDVNGDSILNAGEPSRQTAADGGYAFADLAAGTYVVGQLVPDGWRPTHPLRTGTGTQVVSATSGNWASSTSDYPSVSGDGRFVVFEGSGSHPLAAPGRNIVLYDALTGTYEGIDVGIDGAVPYGNSFRPVISADGRYIGFHSNASNLVPNDTNGQSDIFVYDRQEAVMERVSVSSAGGQSNGGSAGVALSGDGRFVAFGSLASNLVAGDTNGFYDVFVHDRQTRATTRVSVSSGGTQGTRMSETPAISADGRYVVFDSDATNLVPGDTNAVRDIFVRDRQLGTTRRISVSSTGAQAGAGSQGAAISADGHYAAYSSSANNLVSGDTNAVADIFVYELETGQVQRVSLAADGAQPNDHSASRPALSADGSYVAFSSYASNLVPGDVNRRRDVFVADRQSGAVRIASSADGAAANGDADFFALSGDGRMLAFGSAADNVVPGDTNNTRDVFFTPLDGPWRPQAHAVQLGDGEKRSGVDFGRWLPSGRVEGHVWTDVDRNGQRDAGEVGLEGWQVYLDLNGDGQRDLDEPATLTGSDGSYALAGLAQGQYTVAQVRPEFWDQTAPSVGTHARPVGAAQLYTFDFEDLAHGGSSVTVPAYSKDGFTFSTRASSSTSIWTVYGPQGSPYTGSAALKSWSGDTTQWLTREDGRPFTVQSIDLSSSGQAGTHTIVFYGTREGGLPVQQTISIDHVEMQTYALVGFTDIVTLEWRYRLSGSHHQFDNVAVAFQQWDHSGLDFGNMYHTGEIRGSLWHDRNRDGLRDGDEPPLYFWNVYLDLNEDGQLSAGEPSRSTVNTGNYAFLDLVPGRYVVRVVLREEWEQTYPGAPPSTIGHEMQLGAGQVLDRVDFGHRRLLGDIWGTKWNDLNGNGIRDPGEPGLVDVLIYADLNGNGQLDAGEPSTLTEPDNPNTTSVDETGRYRLLNLPPGTYIVAEAVPDGWTQTFPATGTHTITLAADQVLDGFDFGNREIPGGIRGVEWEDRNGDGVRDPDEPGLAGITVFADLNGNGILDAGEPHAVTAEDDPATPEVDETGTYQLLGLLAGDYLIREIVPPGFRQTWPYATTELTFVDLVRDGQNGADALAGASAVAVSPDGRHVYAASYVDDALTVFSRNPIAGNLVFLQSLKDNVGGVDGLNAANSIAISPDGLHVYVASVADHAVAVFSRDVGTGHLSFVQVIRDGGALGLWGAWSVAISPDGSHVYVGSSSDKALNAFSRDPATGRLTFIHALFDNQGGVDGLDAVRSVTVAPDGQHVYTAADNDNAVAVFARNRDTGQLSFVHSLNPYGTNPVDGLYGARGVIVSPDDRHVYVGGSSPGSLVTFSRDAATGELAFLQVLKQRDWDVEGLLGARALASSPDGSLVYAAAYANTLTAVRRDVTTGLLTYSQTLRDNQRLVDGLAGAQAVAVSPGGDHVYTAAEGDNAVAIFQRDGVPRQPVPHKISLAVAQVHDGVDFGTQPEPLGEIRGTKWYDANGNGIRDAEEPPLAGWTIYLDTDGNGRHDPGEPAAITDPDGQYRLADVPAGSHAVRVVLPPGWELTAPLARVELERVAPTESVVDSTGDLAAISADGRWLVFRSAAADLVPGDTNDRADIFVLDRQDGSIQRVSVSSSGAEADGDSFDPSISGDGRLVTFRSAATNLVANDTNAQHDIFVHDRQTGETRRVSVDSQGSQSNGHSLESMLNADGTQVVFSSNASNLVAGDTNDRYDTFAYDLGSGSIQRVSVRSDGSQGNGESRAGPSSADGSLVVFQSLASNLVAADTNPYRDIFLRDLTTGRTRLLSVTETGNLSNGTNRKCWISGDGRYVVYESLASNLVSGDTNGQRDIFLLDLHRGDLKRISTAFDGTQANGESAYPQISGDGRWVVFESTASTLVGVPTGGLRNIYRYDRLTGAIQLVTLGAGGVAADGHSYRPYVNHDGSQIAFHSSASNLVADDTNPGNDVFVARLNDYLDSYHHVLRLEPGQTITGRDFGSRDVLPPSIVTTWPAAGAAGVPQVDRLQLTFSEVVQIGAGSILLRRAADDSIVESIAVSSNAVMVAGEEVSIQLSLPLTDATRYYVQVPAGAFTDAWGHDFAGLADPAEWSFITQGVLGRWLFYNASHFDGGDAAANAADDQAIAADKAPLLPGGTASFLNYSSYIRGINGIMLDVVSAADPGWLDAARFEFRVGNSDSPPQWSNAPSPSSITIRPGAGLAGSDRLTIVWDDGAIKNQWLQVTVRADPISRLGAPDVFCFGNAVGESGNSPSNAFVDGSDFAAARDNPRGLGNRAPLDFRWDYNRDGYVDGSDLAIARDNATNFLTALKLIAIPAAPPAPSPASMPAGEGEATITAHERLGAAETAFANYNAAALPSPSADERKSAQPTETPMGSPDPTAWTAVLTGAGAQHKPARPVEQPSRASSLEESWEALCLLADPLEAILEDLMG